MTNPDTSEIKDENVIITYWVEINYNESYTHKSILFYPNSKQFSKVYNLTRNNLYSLSQIYLVHCTVFRDKDILCSYHNLSINNLYVIETNEIPKENTKNPSIYFIKSDFGEMSGKNMIPISLNKQMKSIYGGYYDIFLAEFSEKEYNNK